MIRGLFVFIFIFFTCSVSFADISNQQAKELAQSKEWKNLLHWRWNLLGGTESEADSQMFFFAKNGKEDLEAELSATVNAFISYKDFKSDDHPICQFPARYLFLKQHIKSLSTLKTPLCNKYKKFVKKLSAKSISIVFSSYLISEPASAFGHTLMRFGKNKKNQIDQSFELLDYAANYSATVTTSNAMLYGVMGLTGGFDGEFATMPYFYKVREYNDFESRDLWDYQLNFTPEEIQRVVAHLWEMKKSTFQYFYLTENCSYHMLGLLDIANPKLSLTDRIPYFVIPSDTVAILANTKGLLRNVTYRPSKMTQLKYRLSLLSEEEKSYFNKTVKDLTLQDTSLSKISQAKVLDTVIDFIDYKFAKQILFKNSKESKFKKNFLIKRAQLRIRAPTLRVPSPYEEMPHLGHKARRLTFGSGVSSRSDFFSEVGYRLSMHELLDLSTGQNPNATMEMGNFSFRYNTSDSFYDGSSKFTIDEFSLVKIVALSPYQKYFSNISWRANFGARSIKDDACLDCFSPTAQIAAGATLKLGSTISYLMVATETDFNSEISHRGYRLAVGPEVRILWRLGKILSWDISGDWKRNFLVERNRSSYSYGSEIRIHSFQNLNFGLKYKRYHKFWDSSGRVFYYF